VTSVIEKDQTDTTQAIEQFFNLRNASSQPVARNERRPAASVLKVNRISSRLKVDNSLEALAFQAHTPI
jgi:hypothetical protein